MRKRIYSGIEADSFAFSDYLYVNMSSEEIGKKIVAFLVLYSFPFVLL